jgi:hypothetical protein
MLIRERGFEHPPQHSTIGHKKQTIELNPQRRDPRNPDPALTDTSGQQDIRRLPHEPAESVEYVSVEDTLHGSLTRGGNGWKIRTRWIWRFKVMRDMIEG